jgi:hypothetical protein
VKERPLVKIEASEHEVVDILRSVPGVEAVVSRQQIGDSGTDAIIHAAGAAHSVAIQVKRYVNAATAHQLVATASRLPAGTELVLIAGSSTAEARRWLEDHGIGVIDGLGNAHVELPGLLLHLEPRRGGPTQEPRSTLPARLTGKAGVVAQALLLQPEQRWTVTTLAGRAEVSTGLAHRVLTRLEKEGIVAAEGAGPHRTRLVQDRAALLDLWAEEASDRRVQRLRAFRLSRDPNNLAEAASRALTAGGVDHAVTGPAAAQKLGSFVTAVPATDIWITRGIELTEAAGLAGAEPVETGHNLILANAEVDTPLAFHTEQDGLSVVNPFRLYLDLRHEPRRGREQAERLRKEVIGF